MGETRLTSKLQGEKFWKKNNNIKPKYWNWKNVQLKIRYLSKESWKSDTKIKNSSNELEDNNE
jgi:hypothetical protein